jgi:hypothetical protein
MLDAIERYAGDARFLVFTGDIVDRASALTACRVASAPLTK